MKGKSANANEYAHLRILTNMEDIMKGKLRMTDAEMQTGTKEILKRKELPLRLKRKVHKTEWPTSYTDVRHDHQQRKLNLELYITLTAMERSMQHIFTINRKTDEWI